MDFVNKLTGSSDENQTSEPSNSNENPSGQGSGGFLGSISDKMNSMAGGGQKSEASEDTLDKAVDWTQEKFMGAGNQNNESATEQFKDEQISDFIRDKYKSATGSDFPIADKDKNYGN